MPLAGARTKEDVDSIMEKTFEEVYEFGRRMGDRIGRTLIRTGMVKGNEGNNVLAQLSAAFSNAVLSGSKEGTRAPDTPANLTLTTEVDAAPFGEHDGYVVDETEDEGEDEEIEQDEEIEPEPTPVVMPKSPRSDPDLVFPKKAGRPPAPKGESMKKPLVCPKCGMFCKNRGAFSLHLWNSHKEKYGDYLASGGITAEKLVEDYERQQAISTEKRNTGNESKNAQLLATLKQQADKYNAEP